MGFLFVGLGAHVMKARHWMVAGLIGLASIGNVMATDLDRQDQGATEHGAMDNGTHDTGGAAGGDALLSAHDGGGSRHATETDSATETERHGAGGGSERSGRASSAPTSARPAAIGWQSLLPGSIQ